MRSTGEEKNRKRMIDFGRRAARLGYDINKIATMKIAAFNEWMREGFDKETAKIRRRS